jgi:hypothetical protein
VRERTIDQTLTSAEHRATMKWDDVDMFWKRVCPLIVWAVMIEAHDPKERRAEL